MILISQIWKSTTWYTHIIEYIYHSDQNLKLRKTGIFIMLTRQIRFFFVEHKNEDRKYLKFLPSAYTMLILSIHTWHNFLSILILFGVFIDICSFLFLFLFYTCRQYIFLLSQKVWKYKTRFFISFYYSYFENIKDI